MTRLPSILMLLAALLAGCAVAPVSQLSQPASLSKPQHRAVAVMSPPKMGLEESLTVIPTQPRRDDLFWLPVNGAEGYRIYAGPSRWQWATNWVSKDNFIRHATNYPAYGIAAFNQSTETATTPWPTNHIYLPVLLYYTDATLEKKLGELKLGSPTNAALFMRIENRYDHSE